MGDSWGAWGFLWHRQYSNICGAGIVREIQLSMFIVVTEAGFPFGWAVRQKSLFSILKISKQKTPVKTGVFCCKDINKQKQQPKPDKQSDYFLATNRANRYGNSIIIVYLYYTIFFSEFQHKNGIL